MVAIIDVRCGTYAGWSAHQRKKESICQPCRKARAVYQSQYQADHSLEIKEYSRKHYVENIVKRKTQQQSWQTANPDKTKNHSAKYRKNNPEKMRLATVNWKMQHPEKGREYVRRREARCRSNGFEKYTESDVLERYGTNCHLCHLPIDLDAPRQVGKEGWQLGLHIEHLVAVANGGRDDLENARPSHGLCNLKKGSRVESPKERIKEAR